MSFLDYTLLFLIICCLALSKPLKTEEQGFNKETTSSLRGLAMICIIFHHIHQRIGTSSPVLGSIGYIVTGLFFFISGYGNTLSINNQVNVNISWFYKKIIKLFIPFIVSYGICYLTLILLYPEKCPSFGEVIVDIMSLSLPNSFSWFPKIILLCFAIHWIIKKIFKERVNLQNVLVLFFIIIYMIIMRKLKYASYWYNSAICYPIGCLIAQPPLFHNLFKYMKKKKTISFAIFAMLFGISCVFRLNGTACTLQREGCPLQTGSF